MIYTMSFCMHDRHNRNRSCPDLRVSCHSCSTYLKIKEEKSMLDIRNHKIEELQFRDSNAEIVAIYDLTRQGRWTNSRVLIIFKQADGVDCHKTTTNGFIHSETCLHHFDVILKPKKTLYVKPLMTLLKQYAFQTSQDGLVYQSRYLIAYCTCGQPTLENTHTPEFINLFCEYKEESHV